MRTLYHLWLSPFCRKVRIVLAEKGLDFEAKVEKVWQRREGFLRLNPAGSVPVLVEPDGAVLAESWVICEYLDEVYPDPPLIGATPAERAETRRLGAWFDTKFHHEVTDNLLTEKLDKRFMGMGGPDSAAIRAGHDNIATHLDYIGYLSVFPGRSRTWGSSGGLDGELVGDAGSMG